MAQWERAGPITQRSMDRNHPLLIFLFRSRFFYNVFYYALCYACSFTSIFTAFYIMRVLLQVSGEVY